MFKFFSRVRKSLISQNKTAAYLKYAIGEIVLVVIGIVIALQINNWNVRKKLEKQEVVTLQQLHDEFESNLIQLDQKIAMRKLMIDAGYQLLDAIDGKTQLSNDTIGLLLNRLLRAPTFDPITNDLISSGRLYLLQNKDLRAILSSWSSELIQLVEEEQNWTRYRDFTIAPFFHRTVRGRNSTSIGWEIADMSEFYFVDQSMDGKVSLGRSLEDEGYEKLFSSIEFENSVSTSISNNLDGNIQSFALRKRILRILELIEESLNEKQ